MMKWWRQPYDHACSSAYHASWEVSTELIRTHLEKSVLPDAKWERMRTDARSEKAEF